MTSTLVLLAGGMASRLRPLTEKIPKSLLEVAGKPFILHQMELVKKNKINKVVICASYLGENIKEYLDEVNIQELEIQYSFDGNELLGTGGAIKKALNLLEDNFFVMYGDSYLDTDFQKINEYFFSKKKTGLMTVFFNEGKYDKSNIEFAEQRILNYDKSYVNNNMKFIDYGLGMLSKNAFNDFGDKFDLETVYKNLLNKNELLGYEVKERFYEIGSFKGLEETDKFLLKNKEYR